LSAAAILTRRRYSGSTVTSDRRGDLAVEEIVAPADILEDALLSGFRKIDRISERNTSLTGSIHTLSCSLDEVLGFDVGPGDLGKDAGGTKAIVVSNPHEIRHRQLHAVHKADDIP
jgi:hypothetical protein